MDINYLLNDYRVSEGRGWKEPTSFGIKPPSWEKPVSSLVVQHKDGGYWMLDTGQKVCPVEEGFPPDDPDLRPDSRTFHHAGRTFTVGYYHDGGPAWVREIDS